MVNVIGLGYIGLPTALMMASHGVEVIGTDYNAELVATLNAGKTTFKEDGLDELFQDALKAGVKFVTEYQVTDTYIVSVPTPYDKFSKKVDACYPERVEHVEHYTAQIPEFALRSKVKGGLTGYAQVYGKYNTTALDKLKMDLVYITNYSLLLDFQIIIETLKIIFRKESTEDFTEERAAEMHDSEFSEGKNCELE